MEAELGNVTWIAVIVGTVVAFLAGWLWYSPILFIRGWAAGSGVDVENGPGPMLPGMVLQLLSLFALALVIGITATQDMLITAIVAVLAASLFSMSNGAFSGKTRYAVLVDGSYILVAGAIMIICQGIF